MSALAEKVTQVFNTQLGWDLNLEPCGWKAEILPLRHSPCRLQQKNMVQSTDVKVRKKINVTSFTRQAVDYAKTVYHEDSLFE